MCIDFFLCVLCLCMNDDFSVYWSVRVVVVYHQCVCVCVCVSMCTFVCVYL